MTWRITLTSGDWYLTDELIDFDDLGTKRWLRVNTVRRAVDGTVYHDLPTKMVHINIAQIVTIKEAEL